MNESAVFPVKLTPFLKAKLEELRSARGESSAEYRGLALQYCEAEQADVPSVEVNLRHYEADDHELGIPGIERLYRRSVVIEPTLICLANCRYCLRSNYRPHTLSEKQLLDIARYCGEGPNRETLSEVLITGGDPMIIPQRLEVLIEGFIEFAPNIKVVRIGTRLFGQDPGRIDGNVERLFRNKPGLRFEVATQINHPVEFFPEMVEAVRRVRAWGAKVYSQNVLLKGVNDDIETLVDLYGGMRRYDIEAHYLFHCVPMKGIHHLRTSLAKGIDLAARLVNSGRVSGRVKPMFAVMTDIGKITFLDGVILARDGGRVLLQSRYRFEDRKSWNPSWALPDSVEVDGDGFLRVWYLDGED